MERNCEEADAFVKLWTPLSVSTNTAFVASLFSCLLFFVLSVWQEEEVLSLLANIQYSHRYPLSKLRLRSFG
jgi:hypothetical protein